MKVHYGVALFLVLSPAYPVGAETVPQGSITDNRVQTLLYNENQIYKIVAYYGYQVDMELAPNEEIRTIAAGDTVGWQIVPAGQHIFIKPMAPNARTNLSVITNRRTYIFDLLARPVTDRWEMTYLVRFKYPQPNIFVAPRSSASPNNAVAFNFSYKISGARAIRPTRVFDDGDFTFFQFDNPRERDLPAIFLVGADGKESLVNYRMDGNYVVVERLGMRFLLRSGVARATVINKLLREPDPS